MLIIHPSDKTTDFLCEIYRDIPVCPNGNGEVIRNGHCSSSLLRKKIKEHDRIVFLGHGTEQGLLRIPYDGGFLISSKFVDLLRNKECVYIWCNADKFVKKYKLNGFATGMIISEAEEALMCCVPFTRETIIHSNMALAKAIAPNITENKHTIFEGLITNYLSNSHVAEFNKNNFFVF